MLTGLGLAAVCSAALAAPATAAWYGSTMKGKANAHYGCSKAAVAQPLGGVALQPTGQRTCTYKHGGYLFKNRPTFLVPRNGRITKIKVKSGRHPAKLRLTILTSSSRVDTITGQDIPGTYTCCTARYIGKPFRPRSNRVTTKRVNVRVHNVRSKKLQIRIHSSDGLALSAVGKGTLPLHLTRSLAGFNTGTPISTSYFPMTRRGDPRVDGYTMNGIDLLFKWNFKGR